MITWIIAFIILVFLLVIGESAINIFLAKLLEQPIETKDAAVVEN